MFGLVTRKEAERIAECVANDVMLEFRDRLNQRFGLFVSSSPVEHTNIQEMINAVAEAAGYKFEYREPHSGGMVLVKKPVKR